MTALVSAVLLLLAAASPPEEGAGLGAQSGRASASRATGTSRPSIWISPTGLETTVASRPALSATWVAAFSHALEQAASEVFASRRFERVSAEKDGSTAQGGAVACATAECTRRVARAAGATEALHSRLTRLASGSCFAVASLHDVALDVEIKRLARRIAPCTADNLLAAAAELGREISQGPRAPMRVTLDLTPLSLPSLEVPDVAAVEDFATTTSSVPRRVGQISIERALEIYAEKHMIIFDDPTNEDGFYVARGGKLVHECDVRRAASAPLTPEIREFCEGNDWEWAWVAFPVGVAVAAVSIKDVSDGGSFRFLFGLSLSAVSAALALAFNVDAVDVTSGRHFSDRRTLARIVERSNQVLRNELDLTVADVEVSGMRR